MENKELNLVEILKDAQRGTKLYSTIYGEVEFERVDYCAGIVYPICFHRDGHFHSVTKEGLHLVAQAGECTLFPSKDNRDWSTFKVPKPKWNPDTLQPFDKVLVKEVEEDEYWTGDLFLYFDNSSSYQFVGIHDSYKCCIPYNEETKQLLGTNKEAPEFYRL